MEDYLGYFAVSSYFGGMLDASPAHH